MNNRRVALFALGAEKLHGHLQGPAAAQRLAGGIARRFRYWRPVRSRQAFNAESRVEVPLANGPSLIAGSLRVAGLFRLRLICYQPAMMTQISFAFLIGL